MMAKIGSARSHYNYLERCIAGDVLDQLGDEVLDRPGLAASHPSTAMIIIPNRGQRILCNDIMDPPTWAWYHLYMEPADLGPTTDADDLVEVVAPWYTPLQVTYWTDALTLGTVAVSYADPLVWTVGAVVMPLQVYGYWVSSGENGALVWCEARVPGPLDMSVTGAVCALWPRFTFTQQLM